MGQENADSGSSAAGVIDEKSILQAAALTRQNPLVTVELYAFENPTVGELRRLRAEGIDPDRMTSANLREKRREWLRQFLCGTLGLPSQNVETDKDRLDDPGSKSSTPLAVIQAQSETILETVQTIAATHPELSRISGLTSVAYPAGDVPKVDTGGAHGKLFPSHFVVSGSQKTLQSQLSDIRGLSIVGRDKAGQAFTVLLKTPEAWSSLRKIQGAELHAIPDGNVKAPGTQKYRIWLNGAKLETVMDKFPADVRVVTDECTQAKIVIEANQIQKARILQAGFRLFPVVSKQTAPKKG